MVAPTILHFSTKGLVDDIEMDLCPACAAIIRAKLMEPLIRPSADLLKLE